MNNVQKVAAYQRAAQEYVKQMEAAGWKFEDRVYERLNRPIKSYYTNKDVARLKEVYSKQRMSMAAKPIIVTFSVPEAKQFSYIRDKDGNIMTTESGVKKIANVSNIVNVEHRIELRPHNTGSQLRKAMVTVLKEHPSSNAAASMHAYLKRLEKSSGKSLLKDGPSEHEVVKNLIDYMPSTRELNAALNTKGAADNMDQLLAGQMINRLAVERSITQPQYAARIKISTDKSNKKLTDKTNARRNTRFTIQNTQHVIEVLDKSGKAYQKARKLFRETTWSDDLIDFMYDHVDTLNDDFVDALILGCEREESANEIIKRWEALLEQAEG